MKPNVNKSRSKEVEENVCFFLLICIDLERFVLLCERASERVSKRVSEWVFHCRTHHVKNTTFTYSYYFSIGLICSCNRSLSLEQCLASTLALSSSWFFMVDEFICSNAKQKNILIFFELVVLRVKWWQQNKFTPINPSTYPSDVCQCH